MSSRDSVRAPVALGLALVVAAGAGSYAWLAASAPSRASSATVAPSAPPGEPIPQADASAAPSPLPSGVPATAPADPQQALDALTGLVPAALAPDCDPADPSALEAGLLPAAGAVAVIRCRQGGNEVVYATLPDLASTQTAFASVVSRSGVRPGADGCWDGSQGAVTYSLGQVACWTDQARGTRTIAWTYEPAHVIASVSSTSKLRTLVSWWWFRALLLPPAGATGLTADEQALVDLMPAGLRATCRHYDPVQDASGYDPVGSLGSIDCFPGVASIADVGLFVFTTPDALATWYDYRVAQAKVKPRSGGCLDGTPGETAWEHGRVLCFVTSGRKAAIRWTDDRYQVYGALNANGKDLPALVDWWAAQRLP